MKIDLLLLISTLKSTILSEGRELHQTRKEMARFIRPVNNKPKAKWAAQFLQMTLIDRSIM
jgi:hypothetical protein